MISTSLPINVATVTMAKIYIHIQSLSSLSSSNLQLLCTQFTSLKFNIFLAYFPTALAARCKMQIMSIEISLVNMQANFIY